MLAGAHRGLRPAAAAVALAALLATAAPATAAAELRTVDLRGLEARSAALLLSGQETGELAASFLARRLPPTATETPVLLVADLVGRSLLEAADGPEMILEVYAYALDDAGQPRATLSRAFRITLPDHRQLLETGGVKFLGELEPAAGAAISSLRLLVLHRASGRFALRTAPLAPAAAGETGGSPPLVLEPAEGWLVASDAEPGWPAGRLPATRLAAGAGARLALALARGAGDAPPVARLLDPRGTPLAELPLDLRPDPSGSPLARGAVLDLSATGQGSYLLEIAAGETGSATRLPLELVSGQLAPGTPWFRPAPAPVDRPPAVELPAPGRPALAERALATYRQAFTAWLAGDLDGAGARLQRFETGAHDPVAGAPLSLERAQVRAAAELAARDPEVLVPLMCLHERLYRLYRADRRPLLANHSRRLASEFARLYAGRGGREAGRIAALVPVSLAGARQEIGARNGAQAAFERALELDPGQPEALLGLAALHESFAHYQTTVELLRRLGRAQPLPASARLRLAINLDRVGSRRQAVAQLRELLEAEPEWVSRLAYQELARLLGASQRGEEALKLLAEARARHPADQRLIIQQAALLDELGKPLAGQRVLAALDELRGDPGDSPRLLYSELPSGQIEAARARLARAASERLAGVLRQTGGLEAGPAP